MMPGQIGRIGWKSTEMMPGQIGHHLPHMPGRFNGFPPNLTNSTIQFDQAGIQCNLNGFAPNSTRQAYNAISTNFHPIQPPYLTRQAYNVISMDFHPIRPGRHTMLSQWISTQFDHLIRPGRHTM